MHGNSQIQIDRIYNHQKSVEFIFALGAIISAFGGYPECGHGDDLLAMVRREESPASPHTLNGISRACMHKRRILVTGINDYAVSGALLAFEEAGRNNMYLAVAFEADPEARESCAFPTHCTFPNLCAWRKDQSEP